MAPCQTICIHMDPPKEIKFQRPTVNRKTLQAEQAKQATQAEEQPPTNKPTTNNRRRRRRPLRSVNWAAVKIGKKCNLIF